MAETKQGNLKSSIANAIKPSIIDRVREAVSPIDYYSWIIPDLHWPRSGHEARTVCVFHTDHDPSLHFNPETGAWFCHGCDAGGNSIVSFHAQYYDLSNQDAAAELYKMFVRPIVEDKKVRRWVRRLKETPSAINYLQRERYISTEIIDRYDLGFNGTRITIPIRDEFGLCVNVKLYDPIYKQHDEQKMYNYSEKEEERSFAEICMLYPLSSFELARELGYVVVCEGEFDTLVLISMGIPAVTTTNGSKSWPDQYNELFRGLNVVIAYDNDKDGTTYDRRIVVKRLRKFAKRISRLNIPRIKGRSGKCSKDVTDWFAVDQRMRTREAWEDEIGRATLMIENPDEYVEKTELKDVALDEASHAENYGQRIKVRALVTGKDTAPYLLPRKFRVTCDRSCDDCPLVESKNQYRTGEFDPSDPRVLTMIDASQPQVRKLMLGTCGISDKPTCKGQTEILDTFNVEQLLLIPTIEEKGGQYVNRAAFYAGHGLRSNRAYEFCGVTVPNPQDQHSTHLFDEARPVQDEIETFRLTPELIDRLKVFQPEKRNLLAHLVDIAEWQSRVLTKIRERPDLHITVDLVFHSVQSFEFNREMIPRGMLDVLIIGDTRCGKGSVAEGLVRYYNLGEIASGENCSFSGLIGGIDEVGRRRIIKWGKIPLNHNRAVIIDEASGMTQQEIARMSRVRSEGIAEINKIISESTRANTRLLWLTNTRSGEKMEKYDNGLKAIKELIGANEDISRFDFALTVAVNEVPGDVINSRTDYTVNDADRFPPDLCRSLILWAWSRKPEQVQFSEQATDEVIKTAIEFGDTYSSDVPLVQAENIRVKLAKVSASVAARVFSSDSQGENLYVGVEHVKCAAEFLRWVYSKPSMRYDTFSRQVRSITTIQTMEPIDKVFDILGVDREPVIDGLLSTHRVTLDGIADYLGDVNSARAFLGELVKLKCLARVEQGNSYLKNPAFSKWLRGRRKEHYDDSGYHEFGPRQSEPASRTRDVRRNPQVAPRHDETARNGDRLRPPQGHSGRRANPPTGGSNGQHAAEPNASAVHQAQSGARGTASYRPG
jgi:5S rRNA maturation endonuclease (ribonuclease M5)